MNIDTRALSSWARMSETYAGLSREQKVKVAEYMLAVLDDKELSPDQRERLALAASGRNARPEPGLDSRVRMAISALRYVNESPVKISLDQLTLIRDEIDALVNQ